MQILDGLEALLFVAESPVTLEQLSTSLACPMGAVEQALEVLGRRLEENGPIQLVQIAGGFQLCTKPEFAELVANFLRPQRQKLSKSLMEVLAIVAYRQPVTLAEIEQIRGVQSDYAVRGLLERHLLREVGRKKAPGRPHLYGTTPQFLHGFKLRSLDDLPNLAPETPDLPKSQLELRGLHAITSQRENSDLPDDVQEEA